MNLLLVVVGLLLTVALGAQAQIANGRSALKSRLRILSLSRR